MPSKRRPGVRETDAPSRRVDVDGGDRNSGVTNDAGDALGEVARHGARINNVFRGRLPRPYPEDGVEAPVRPAREQRTSIEEHTSFMGPVTHYDSKLLSTGTIPSFERDEENGGFTSAGRSGVA